MTFSCFSVADADRLRLSSDTSTPPSSRWRLSSLIFSETSTEFKSKAVNENQGKLELRCWWIANQIRRIQGFGKGIGGYYLYQWAIICNRLEAQREETKGPHSSLSESLFQNSVTGNKETPSI
ncbi:hypothetical protein LXL04_034434 [Taraxacum kok-saghyz]